MTTEAGTWTHIRLNIFPDGGVARLRVYGTVVPDWSKMKAGELIDLAAVENGGVALSCSDMFFSSMNNLVMPGRAENMGDGWETKRDVHDGGPVMAVRRRLFQPPPDRAGESEPEAELADEPGAAGRMAGSSSHSSSA